MRALFPLRMKVKEISPEDYAKPMGYLAGMKEFLPDAEESSLGTVSAEKQDCVEDFIGEMLVMAGLVGSRVDQVLRAIRKSGISVPYKAVLTASNQSWNAYELFAEIKKEHELMTGGGVS